MNLETHIRRKLLRKPVNPWIGLTAKASCVCCRRAIVDADYRDVCRDCLRVDRLGTYWNSVQGFDNSGLDGLSTPIGELE